MPSIDEQAANLTVLFTVCGWPAAGTRTGIELILHNLAEIGSRPAAYEALRRSKRCRAITGLPAKSWTALLRLVLGRPNAGITSRGQGILLRLALGEKLTGLLNDGALLADLLTGSPVATDNIFVLAKRRTSDGDGVEAVAA